MAIAALVTWLVTAGIGLSMLVRWLKSGGLRGGSQQRITHFPPARVFTHFGLAAAGLVIWIVYLVTGNTVLTWVAFADLVLVAVLGGLLVQRWARDGRAAMAAGPGSAAAGVDLAEQHIPRGPVVLHGIFAVSTVVLVLLTTLGLGGD
jgi:manganese efflux pump family protein